MAPRLTSTLPKLDSEFDPRATLYAVRDSAADPLTGNTRGYYSEFTNDEGNHSESSNDEALVGAVTDPRDPRVRDRDRRIESRGLWSGAGGVFEHPRERSERGSPATNEVSRR